MHSLIRLNTEMKHSMHKNVFVELLFEEFLFFVSMIDDDENDEEIEKEACGGHHWKSDYGTYELEPFESIDQIISVQVKESRDLN